MNSRFAGAAAACGAPAADCGAAVTLLRAARPPADRCLRLTMFSADEIYRIMKLHVAQKRTRDYYDLSVVVVNAAASTIAPVLAGICNRCMREGLFPGPLKESKITPLYKGKGNRDDMDSYRPVSIIPVVAKVFENGLCSRLKKHLDSTNALSERQFAYREGHSTTGLAREVVRRIVIAREDRQKVAVLCCDLSKAFDVADRNVLANKLLHYGIAGSTHALLVDLLSERVQRVMSQGGKTKSDPIITNIGVAQGSSVSNILFSIMLNDLPQAVTGGEAFMYADDVAVVVTAPSQRELERKLNLTASQLCRWFEVNGLVLNLRKTHFIDFDLSGNPRNK
ncbi:reverse transcriptase (RNA-dependent DNA polymerase) domain-containing protein [Phthorimaea operculella]|nr:reverse transcriptase (RNA-dependent DNA polymerase) domain-containing protein [Phthorimaea operculella]